MQELTFAEIRQRYKEKQHKKLGWDDATLGKKLEGYSIHRKGRHCSIMVQDRQKECEDIVDSIILQNQIHNEQDVNRKYRLLLETLPEEERKRFPDTIRRHEGYIQHLINNRKNKNSQMVHSFRALETMLSLMDKEITEYSDEELSGLIKDKSFTVTTKQHAVWFLKYICNKEPGQFRSSLEMSLLRRDTIRQEDDFYTPEEWAAFAGLFLDAGRHIGKAYGSCLYARYWLYALLHMSLAWRKSDVLGIPALENLADISGYTLEWFQDNTLSMEEAQKVISRTKLAAEQYHTQKTGARKHFNIPQAALIPTATAIIICEQWRRKEEAGKNASGGLFGKLNVCTKRLTELFGLETDFLSMKANRTLLSMFNETAGGMAGLSGKAGTLTSYMRSHKVSKMGSANVTKVYLHSTYDERESASMGKQNMDRGAFGWLYDRLLDLAGGKKDTFRENTEMIAQVREQLPAWKAEDFSGTLYGIVKERELLLDEIYSWDSSEIKEKAELLFSGKLLSRVEDVSCIMGGKCPYPTEDKCLLCRYSIPTTFSLTLAGDELLRLLTEFGKTGSEDVADRTRLTFQIGKLTTLLKEAIARFGYGYIEAYIDYKKINELIKKEAPNMIFLEETQNDGK